MTVAEIAEMKVETLSSPPNIPTDFLNLSGKQAPLINRTDLSTVELTNGKITIKFKDPAWIYDITFWISEDSIVQTQKITKHTQILIKYSRGPTKAVTLEPSTKFADFYLRDFIDEIQITFSGRSSLKSLISPTICKKIVLRGFSTEEFHEFSSNVSDFLSSSANFHKARDSIIEDLTTKEAILVKKTIEISEQENTIETLNSEIEALSQKEKNIQIEIEKSQAKLEIINNKSTELEEKSTTQHEINNNLLKDIETNRAKRDTLLTDNNIFMEEFSSYVKQGRESINSYIVIGTACFLILFVCLYRLITSSLTLVRDPEILKEISAFDLLLSRLPFALVLGIIMVATMKILFQLLNKIFEIHQERLLLTKLSIIAKDNAFFSADGLNISAEMIYSQKSLLKMELLKEFLAGNYRSIPAKQKEIKSRLQDFINKHQALSDDQIRQEEIKATDLAPTTKP